MNELRTHLAHTRYPGRGILLATLPDHITTRIAYFIMGRSQNSQNRVFESTADGIKTRAFDEAKMEDPSLIIYHPVRVFQDKSVVVTNGDQTDTIIEALKAKKCFRHALKTRTFEPDAPNYTPRISGIVKPDGTYALSIIKSENNDPKSLSRFFFEYDTPRAGWGHFVSTYAGDGEPLPSFVGEPLKISMDATSIDAFSRELWEALDSEYKVALYVADVDTNTHERHERIINKHNQEG